MVVGCPPADMSTATSMFLVPMRPPWKSSLSMDRPRPRRSPALTSRVPHALQGSLSVGLLTVSIEVLYPDMTVNSRF